MTLPAFSQVREFKCDRVMSMDDTLIYSANLKVYFTDNQITIGDSTGYRMYTIISKIKSPTENIYRTLEDGKEIEIRTTIYEGLHMMLLSYPDNKLLLYLKNAH